ncbi:MAG: hypothetical protein IPO37_19685 [Saprospiraceae bacterium]|nr:hypothetical protein [Saprospiraceae bacterium]
MKLKFEIVPVRELEDGDIFYCTPDFEMNEFGEDYFITGTDQIFIKDDYYDEDDDGNYAILVNGGWHVWFRPDEKVVRLAHYSKLIRVIDMVKEGNPDMSIGPNDSTTIINHLQAEHPEFNIDLLSGLDINLEFDDEDKQNPEDDELPF